MNTLPLPVLKSTAKTFFWRMQNIIGHPTNGNLPISPKPSSYDVKCMEKNNWNFNENSLFLMALMEKAHSVPGYANAVASRGRRLPILPCHATFAAVVYVYIVCASGSGSGSIIRRPLLLIGLFHSSPGGSCLMRRQQIFAAAAAAALKVDLFHSQLYIHSDCRLSWWRSSSHIARF